jgi:hypothetical protein
VDDKRDDFKIARILIPKGGKLTVLNPEGIRNIHEIVVEGVLVSRVVGKSTSIRVLRGGSLFTGTDEATGVDVERLQVDTGGKVSGFTKTHLGDGILPKVCGVRVLEGGGLIFDDGGAEAAPS